LQRADGTVKICDFGSSKWYPPSSAGGALREDSFLLQRTRTVVGTPAFCAPEDCQSVYAPKGPYESFRADIWSLGATLYYLVFGRVPFEGNGAREMFDSVCKSKLLFPTKPGVSAELKDLLRAILVKQPMSRPSLDEISQHAWLQQGMRTRMPTQDNSEFLTFSEDDLNTAILSIKAAIRSVI